MFDEQPDGDPHGECALEIKTLQARIAELEAQVDALRAERDALKVDAERYRWLRAQNWNDGILAVVANPLDAVKLGHDCPSMFRLDAAIDAAMNQPKESA